MAQDRAQVWAAVGKAAMKCQKCHNPATLHITEVLSEGQFEELHLCDQCANKYPFDAQQKGGAKGAAMEALGESEEAAALNQKECPHCGIKFVEFRNSGRLGCPHDYQEFRDELTPLLENIHGETRHVGKAPQRLPQNKQTQTELIQLRNRLKNAINKEDYEAAAQLRDQIKTLEES
jgi:protein arginine kinase activator